MMAEDNPLESITPKLVSSDPIATPTPPRRSRRFQGMDIGRGNVRRVPRTKANNTALPTICLLTVAEYGSHLVRSRSRIGKKAPQVKTIRMSPRFAASLPPGAI